MSTSSESQCPVVPCSMQNYYQRNNIKTIIRPNNGSILSRKSKLVVSSKNMFIDHDARHRNEQEEVLFVVTDIRLKKRGNNKGIVDCVFLERIITISESNDYVCYEKTKHPMVLALTNHGDWGDKTMTSEYDLYWDPIVQSPLLLLSPRSSTLSPRSSTLSFTALENPIVTQFKQSSPLKIPMSPSANNGNDTIRSWDESVDRDKDKDKDRPITPRRWSLQSTNDQPSRIVMLEDDEIT